MHSGTENRRVIYVGCYDVLRDGKQLRLYSLASVRKMDFVCGAIRETGRDVEIVSPSCIRAREFPFTGGVNEVIGDGITLTLPASWGAKHKPARVARVLWSRLWLFLYLMAHAGKGQPVIVYHNYEYAVPLLLARFFKRFRLVLEIEEKYDMVWKLKPLQRWKEKLLLKHGTAGSLVVSEVLAEYLDIKDPVVSYGSYSAYSGRISGKTERSVKMLVYTGAVDRVRGGAFLAVEAMRYLPDNYRLVISGPADKDDEEAFLSTVEKVNAQCGRIAVEYRGVLNDSDYENLLLDADIALNPQQAGGFGGFLFPSKILTYMSYGLPVVSTPGESIVKSQIADLITFSEEFEAESIADAIMKVRRRSPEVYTDRLNELKAGFVERLRMSLEGADV